ncbi:MAG: hypothetical protein ACI8RN_000998 [Glaciecola sp.]|jgi:hypothetical protein
MSWHRPVTLSGEHASLMPLSASHGAKLAAAAQDGEVLRIWHTNVPSPDEMPGAIERIGAKSDGILRSHSRHSNGTLPRPVFTRFWKVSVAWCQGAARCNAG